MRLLRLIGIVWLVVALGTLGYFASLEIGMLTQLGHDSLRASPDKVKHLISTKAAVAESGASEQHR